MLVNSFRFCLSENVSGFSSHMDNLVGYNILGLNCFSLNTLNIFSYFFLASIGSDMRSDVSPIAYPLKVT